MAHKNPKQKGNAFENHMAKTLAEWTGYRWKKTILSGGTAYEKGDVAPAHKKIKWTLECKNTQGWSYKDLWTHRGIVWKWVDKLMEDNPPGFRPMLVMKQNRAPLIVGFNKRLAGVVKYNMTEQSIVHKDVRWYFYLLDDLILNYDGSRFFRS